MKSLFSTLLLVVFCVVSQAQIKMPKIDANSSAASLLKDFVKPPAIGDIAKTSGSIADLLGSKLSLPADQKPKLVEALSGFLTDKKGIASLADTKPADYLAKFNPLQKGLFGKLKGIMGAAAFTKMLGLKPSGSDIAGNALSHLFF